MDCSHFTHNRLFYPSLLNFFETNANSKEFFTDFVCGAADISYAVIGSVARKVYVGDAVMTKDIDILTTDSYELSIRNIFRNIGTVENIVHDKQFRYSKKECDVYIDLLIAQDFEDPEESCVEDADKLNIYGMDVRIAKPEYLVWMLLRSDQKRHHADAQDIINNTGAEWRRRLLEMMKNNGDSEEADMFVTMCNTRPLVSAAGEQVIKCQQNRIK
jgi:hypothetical protein